MGGSAFSSGLSPLFTPRMPKEVYGAVKIRCHKVLLDLYDYVSSPVEGPAKKDFGDIDILVASPKCESSSGSEALSIISQALDAKRMIAIKGNGISANLAIPWPTGDDHPNPVHQESKADNGSPDKYVQVDVRVCDTTEQMQWMLFKHAHGDLWNLLGSMIRHYGLTVDDTAMWLRVPEIEEFNKKRARVFLTSEPSEVLRFLGLPGGEVFDHPFNDIQDMYEYAAQCRLMYVSPVEGEPTIKNLKSNDRRRMTYRPTFKKWIDEFIPQCRQLGRFAERMSTREVVTQEAFEWFHVEEEFTRRRDEFLLERQKDHIWNHVIKGSVPEPENAEHAAILYRSCLVKALKRIILEGDLSYGILPENNLKDDNGHFIMENVVDFITKNQHEVGDAALARHNGRYVERLQSKLAPPQ